MKDQIGILHRNSNCVEMEVLFVCGLCVRFFYKKTNNIM